MIFGYMAVFNEVEWIGYAIEQAVEWCDKILIVEGSQFVAFPDIPERSDDGTLDIINDKARQYPEKIKIVNTIRVHENYRHNSSANCNMALDYCKVGDYFFALDADEFYLNEWMKEAMELMREGVDFIKTPRWNFTFNFKWLIDRKPNANTPVIGKKIEGTKFIPTRKWRGTGKNVAIISSSGQFHYTWLKPTERMRIRMRTSGMYRHMVDWLEETWLKIEPEDGVTYPFYHGNFILHKYEGQHPSILDNHPWRHIEDVRKL